MRIDYESFYIQKYADNTFVDDEEIKGTFTRRRPVKTMEAGSEEIITQGEFSTHPTTPVDRHSIVRRVRDNRLFELTGDPIITPKRARVQSKVYEAKALERV